MGHDPVLANGIIETLLGVKKVTSRLVQKGDLDPNEMRLTIEARRREVRRLSAGGLSERRIAAVIGTSRKVVSRDLGRVPKEPKTGSKGAGPDPDRVNGYARESVEFTQRFVNRLGRWLKQNPDLCDEAKSTLVGALHQCAADYERAARYIINGEDHD